MRPFASLPLFVAICGTVFSAPPEVKESEGRIEIRNDHYSAVIEKSQGGVLLSLTSRDGKTQFLSDHRIYTDYGFYPGRGYVGTKNETKPEVALKRDGDRLTVSAKGMLRGERAEGKTLIPYQLVCTFDGSPSIAVECEVVPFDTGEEVQGFLATCFVVPSMSEWAVHTIDGIIREDVKETTGRNYEAQKLWIDAKRPQVGFITADGASLLATDIRCDGPDELQNIIIHGKAFFLAWLSGAPARVKPAPHRVRFRLVVGRGDPMG